MQRKTFHIALDFFAVGAAVPALLLLIWKLFFEHHFAIAAENTFLKIAMILWPTGMQILVVPHGEGDLGHAIAIAILVVQNALLYSVVALLVAWVIGRVRHHPHTPQMH
jgi:hypothetical protein